MGLTPRVIPLKIILDTVTGQFFSGFYRARYVSIFVAFSDVNDETECVGCSRERNLCHRIGYF